jgi:hypothetical protein
MRGTENPQTSTSTTPTRWPSAASAAHPALPRGDGDHGGVGPGEEGSLLDRGRPAAELRHQLLALVVGHLAQDHLDPLAGIQDGADRSPHVGVDAVLEGTSGDGQQDVDANEAVVDLDALEHADVLDRLADLGVEDGAEGLANLFLGGHRDESSLSAPGLS